MEKKKGKKKKENTIFISVRSIWLLQTIQMDFINFLNQFTIEMISLLFMNYEDIPIIFDFDKIIQQYD